MNDGTIAKIRDGKFRAIMDTCASAYGTTRMWAFEVCDVGIYRDRVALTGPAKRDEMGVPLAAWNALLAAVEGNPDDTRAWHVEWTEEGGWAKRLTLLPNPWAESAK